MEMKRSTEMAALAMLWLDARAHAENTARAAADAQEVLREYRLALARLAAGDDIIIRPPGVRVLANGTVIKLGVFTPEDEHA